MTWREIRDSRGKLLARYDASRELIEVASRGQSFVIDLRVYRHGTNGAAQPYGVRASSATR